MEYSTMPIIILLGIIGCFGCGFAFAISKVNAAFRTDSLNIRHYGLIIGFLLLAWMLFAFLDVMIPWLNIRASIRVLIRLFILIAYIALIYGLARSAPIVMKTVLSLIFLAPLAVMQFCPWNTRKSLEIGMGKIKFDMSEQQVKEIMKGKTITKSPHDAHEIIFRHPNQAEGDCDGIVVYLDENDKVNRMSFNYD